MALIAGADFFKFQRNVPALALADERADRILIEKAERRLTLLRDGKVLKTYRSSLGRTPLVTSNRKATAARRKEIISSTSRTGAAAIIWRCVSLIPTYRIG